MSIPASRLATAILLIGTMVLGACAEVPGAETTRSRASTKTPHSEYAMRWDHKAQSTEWTARGLAALESHGAALPAIVPADIETWCPGYADASQADREAFWIGLISALAKHESTWNPAAVGGGGRWFGLVQISPATARLYGCEAKSGSALKNGAANISCAIRIMSRTVQRDGVVSAGMRGVAADWGPFHTASKRKDMIAWTSSQPFCQPKAKGPLAMLKKKMADG